MDPFGMNPASVANQHFAVQNDALAQVNDAVEQEMRSRVNQQREARRLQQEMEIERMRQETALRKIQAESEARERLARMQADAQSGVLSRLTVDGRGRVAT